MAHRTVKLSIKKHIFSESGTKMAKDEPDRKDTSQPLDSELVSEVLEEATMILQAVPNIQKVSTALFHRITICGDLHGQMEDLALIFQMNGLPDIFNPYIFNGDFVDRGSNSVEVLIILLACLIAHPSAVFLNRGNHEDPLYGFVDEIRSKYPKQSKKILKQIETLFCSIPLCTILDDVILVCHGGISRTTDLSKIMKIDRKMFSSVLQPTLEGENAVSIDDWRQVLDVLWSDPQVAPGCKPNIKRGGGSYFGPDVTTNLLNHLKIGILIRSHECCPNGWKMDHNNQVETEGFMIFQPIPQPGKLFRVRLSPSVGSVFLPGDLVLFHSTLGSWMPNRAEVLEHSSQLSWYGTHIFLFLLVWGVFFKRLDKDTTLVFGFEGRSVLPTAFTFVTDFD
ncbi:hypothetical protein ACTXT7_011062 [Hymenolepis weldensis]